jgi:hypothetical protein
VTVRHGGQPLRSPASGNRNELACVGATPDGFECYYRWSTLFPRNFPIGTSRAHQRSAGLSVAPEVRPSPMRQGSAGTPYEGSDNWLGTLRAWNGLRAPVLRLGQGHPIVGVWRPFVTDERRDGRLPRP